MDAAAAENEMFFASLSFRQSVTSSSSSSSLCPFYQQLNVGIRSVSFSSSSSTPTTTVSSLAAAAAAAAFLVFPPLSVAIY